MTLYQEWPIKTSTVKEAKLAGMDCAVFLCGLSDLCKTNNPNET